VRAPVCRLTVFTNVGADENPDANAAPLYRRLTSMSRAKLDYCEMSDTHVAKSVPPPWCAIKMISHAFNLIEGAYTHRGQVTGKVVLEPDKDRGLS